MSLTNGRGLGTWRRRGEDDDWQIGLQSGGCSWPSLSSVTGVCVVGVGVVGSPVNLQERRDDQDLETWGIHLDIEESERDE